MRVRPGAALLLAAGLGAAAPLRAEPAAIRPATSCIACHGALDDEALSGPVSRFEDDVHAAAGLGCEDCHGGDPAPSLAEDLGAMSPEAGFRPPPGRLAIPDFCARCHADPTIMRRFDPQARVDQLAEYRTSVHGLKNAQGDPTPATCTDCHEAHGIRPVLRPDAPVHATNVPGTCARCHANAVTMAPYGIPTDQYAEWRRSVHAAALLVRGDTAAPACNDCHGNHGATPPGFSSVANVCGQCHAREAALFRESFKSALFDTMGVAECSACHGNHRVLHPTPELFRTDAAPAVASGRVTSTDPFAADLGRLEAGAATEAAWYAVLAPHVTAADEASLRHLVSVAAEGREPILLDATVRPEVAEDLVRSSGDADLAALLRIEPVSGPPVRAGEALRLRLEVRAPSRGLDGVRVETRPGSALHTLEGSVCLTCHSPGDACDQATERMYAALASLDRDLEEAASVLHRAEVAGMDVGAPLFELRSQGTTASVESRALIHSFDPARLVARTEEGRAVAGKALETGRAALSEIEYRRKGLAVSLVLVGLVLLALYLKIREVDRGREAGREA